MEDWQLEFEWLKVRHYVKDAFDRKDLPDLQTILFLIGIQELGQLRKEFTKEEKQDLMHIAVCSLLANEGIYEYVGRDQDGWPHFEKQKNITIQGVEAQERLLMQNIISYFEQFTQSIEKQEVH